MSGIKPAVGRPDERRVAIAVASPSAYRSLRLARPFSRSGFESAILGALLLSAVGIWMLVIPVELLGVLAA
jgi:hypothetical protein